MIFKQLFDHDTSTFTYLIASAPGREAILIDPVKTHMDKYTTCSMSWMPSWCTP